MDETKTWDVSPTWSTTCRATADGKAIIADPRNDQTLIILQLHVAMQMFHNKLVDLMRKQLRAPGGRVRVGPAAGPVALPVDRDPRVPARHRGQDHGGLGVQGSPHRGADHQHQVLQADEPAGRSFIPVEFAVAAYRFGHSITRPRYTVRDVFDSTGQAPGRRLGRAAVPGRAHRQQLERAPPAAASAEDSVEQVLQRGPRQPTARPVRQFDASLADPLFTMPSTALPDTNTLGLLSQRNLRRGRKMGLPSGQQVARLMGVTPLTPPSCGRNHRIEVTHPDRRQRGEVAARVRRGEPEPQGRSSPIRNGAARRRCGSTS